MGRNRNGAYLRVSAKSRKKAKDKLRRLTSRSQGRKLDTVFYNLKVFMRGWLNYYAIAEMKNLMEDWNGWLRRRIRMYIWKQWKRPRTRVQNLAKLGMPEWQAYRNAVICLNRLDPKRERLYEHPQKLYRILRRMLLKAIDEPQPGTLVYRRPLV